MKRTVLSLLLATSFLPGLCAYADDKASDTKTVNKLADDYVAAFIQYAPEAALLSGFELPENDRFSDNTLPALKAWQQKEDAWSAALAKVNGETLVGTPASTTYGFLKEALESARITRVCRNELWSVNQIWGWQMTIAALAGAQPVGTAQRRQQLLKQWRGLPQYLQTEISNLNTGLKSGYSSPKHNVQRVIDQLDGFVDVPVHESPLYSPAERDNDDTFRAQWRTLLADKINPAIRQYRDYLKNTYLAKARDSIGVSAHPNGEACYAASLRASTGLEISPAQMYAQGEKYVAEGLTKARALAEKNYGTTDLQVLRERMSKDPANHFSSREEVLGFSQAAVDRAIAATATAFNLRPKAAVRIEPMPAYEEAFGVPHYNVPAADGSRPGVYSISLYEPEKQIRARVEATAFHEAVPGHHLQMAIAQERTQSHDITRLVNNGGFTEGWAMYAEEVADEMGLFSSDLTRLGKYLQLPTGMMVDPGIHVMGWTRQQAIDYIVANRADHSPERAAMQTDRMAVTPGQMTTYYAGLIAIRALRDESEKQLGKNFNMRLFHDAILEDGGVTLPMLQQKIQLWLSAQKG